MYSTTPKLPDGECGTIPSTTSYKYLNTSVPANYKFFGNQNMEEEEEDDHVVMSRSIHQSAEKYVKPRQLLHCVKCDYKSYHKHALDRHTSAVHEKIKVHTCDHCDYKTGHASALKRHISKLHDRSSQAVFGCHKCNYTTIHKSALKRHVGNRHEKESMLVHKCSVCEYVTTYEFALERHISTVHLKEGGFKCVYCEYETVHKHAMDRHVKMVHEKPESIQCKSCSFKTAYKSALKMHHATVHESRDTFRCSRCGYETLYKTALQRHMQTVTCNSTDKMLDAGTSSENISPTPTYILQRDAGGMQEGRRVYAGQYEMKHVGLEQQQHISAEKLAIASALTLAPLLPLAGHQPVETVVKNHF